MGIRTVECLDWKATDRPGEMLTFAEGFRKDGINLDALWGYVDSKNGARIAAVGKNPARLKAALRKRGVKPRVCEGFYVTGKDRIGALVDVFKKLSSAKVNIECAEAYATQGKYAGTIWVDRSNFKKAKKVLGLR